MSDTYTEDIPLLDVIITSLKIDDELDNSADDDISVENMLLQDLLSLNIGSALFGKYLYSVDSLISKLNKNIYNFKEIDSKDEKGVLNQRSIYLPDYDQTVKMIDMLETLQDTIIEMSKNSDKVDVDTIKKYIKELGIDINDKTGINTDWKVSSGSILGAIVLGAVASTASPIFIYFSAQLSKGLLSRNGRSIYTRGWHSINQLVECSERFIKILSKTKDIGNAFEEMSNRKIGENISDAKRRIYKDVGFILKKSFKAYKNIVIALGRGLTGVSLSRHQFKEGLKESLIPKKKDDTY